MSPFTQEKPCPPKQPLPLAAIKQPACPQIDLRKGDEEHRQQAKGRQRDAPRRTWKKAVLAAAVSLAVLPALAQESFKLGVVSFLSGQAAESFGVPAVNAGKMLIDQFNKGTAPAP